MVSSTTHVDELALGRRSWASNPHLIRIYRLVLSLSAKDAAASFAIRRIHAAGAAQVASFSNPERSRPFFPRVFSLDLRSLFFFFFFFCL
ncbi:hypothetical protein AAC387_Pa05g3657 [Persea americana]